jgi:hypothetical protein
MASLLRFAAPLAILAAASCSFLLDTESLKGGAGPAAGSGGASNDGGLADQSAPDATADATADGDAGPKSCASDYDCIDFLADACMQSKCVNKLCAPPVAFKGPAVAPTSDAKATGIVADAIGIPVLAADKDGIVLAAYSRNLVKTEVELAIFPNAGISGSTTTLSALVPSFSGFGTSPGLLTSGAGAARVLHMIVAATAADAGGAAMHLVDFDLNATTIKPSAVQPIDPNVPVSVPSAGTEKITAPRLYATGQAAPAPAAIGMWVDNGALGLYDGTASTVTIASKRVIAFAPLGAPTGVHAALQTLDGSNQIATDLWSKGNVTLGALSTPASGTPRGIAATSADEVNDPRLNLILWSRETAFVPAMEMAYAACTSSQDQCVAQTEPWATKLADGGTEPVSARWPTIASSRLQGDPNSRDVAEAFVVRYPNADQTSTSILFAALSRLTFSTGTASSKDMNPAVVFIQSVSNATTAPVGDAIGTPSIAIGPTGQMLVAWVQHEKSGSTVLPKDVLYTRQYQVKVCQ